jgi:uncharacterized protein (TIGR00255 family)
VRSLGEAMIRAMTGYGTGLGSVKGAKIDVEVSSFNHKFCEVKVRMPRELGALEHEVVRIVKEQVVRGSVDVAVRRAPSVNLVTPRIDQGLAESYARAFAQVQARLGLPGGVTLANVINAEGVVRLDERAVDMTTLGEALQGALAAALLQFESMRVREGEALERDLTVRLDEVDGLVGKVAELAPQVLEQYRARLSARIARLAGGTPVDPARVAQEVAAYGDRTDVAEEVTRLRSHVSQVRALLRTPDPAGRKLEFLVQEMHREANTMGSKSQSVEIVDLVMALKAEIERMREEVQNVE